MALYYFKDGGRFQMMVHEQFPVSNNSDGMEGMDPAAWKAKCAKD